MMGIGYGECKNLVIENMTFQNFTDTGIYAFESTGVVIRSCVFRNNGFESLDPDFEHEGFGVIVSDSTDVLIENNESYYNGPKPAYRDRGILGTGIDTYTIRDATIRGNSSHDNTGGGLLIEDGVNVLVENNHLERNYLDATVDGWWDAGVWVDGGHDVTVRSNTIRDNLGPGIQMSDSDLQYHKTPRASYGYTAEDNIISGNYFALYTLNFGQCPLPPRKTSYGRTIPLKTMSIPAPLIPNTHLTVIYSVPGARAAT